MKNRKTFEDVLEDPFLKKMADDSSDLLDQIWNVGKITK